MRRYLFDTNIISDLIKNPASNMALKLFDLPQDSFCTSVIVACELRYGAHKKRVLKII